MTDEELQESLRIATEASGGPWEWELDAWDPGSLHFKRGDLPGTVADDVQGIVAANRNFIVRAADPKLGFEAALNDLRAARLEIAALKKAMTAAAAELRHTYRAAFLVGRAVNEHDGRLISRAVGILEQATTPKEVQ